MESGITSSGTIKPGTVVKFTGDERGLGPQTWLGKEGTVIDRKIDGWDVVVKIPETGHGDIYGFDVSELEIVT